ncbi:hypothetical protein D3C78_1706090 [compost metagenome]
MGIGNLVTNSIGPLGFHSQLSRREVLYICPRYRDQPIASLSDSCLISHTINNDIDGITQVETFAGSRHHQGFAVLQ